MEIKPVKQTEKPKYPLKTEINDEVLKKQIPKRWMQSPAAKIALGTLAAVTLAGCGPEPEPIVAGGTMAVAPPTETTVSVSPEILSGTPEPIMINVAPLFEHGEGRGAFGGDMASIPAFLSEDEALAVINEIAKGYGLEFTSNDAPVFDNVLQPSSCPNPPESIENSVVTKQPDKIITLQTDFADIEHGIAIEFVSKGDVMEWRQWPVTSTVEVFDTKNSADQLNDSLEAAVHREYSFYTVGVLYDPCEYSKDEAEAKNQSIEQLKMQAKDFFEWLKNQGVI